MAISGTTHQTRVLYALQGCCKTLCELNAELGLTNRQISDAAASLVLTGYAERKERGCFQLTSGGRRAVSEGKQITSGPNAPHVSANKPKKISLRQRAWNAMRIQGKFTISDIQMAAARDVDRNAKNNLQKYFRQLAKAGYLHRLRRRIPGTKPTSGGFLKYSLIRDSGDLAPSYRSTIATVFDHNTGEEHAI